MYRMSIFILLSCSFCFSQGVTKYPFPIVGDGQTEVVFPASQDTFWVFKHSQYLRALAIRDSLHTTRDLLSLYKQKFAMQKEILDLQMSITDTVKFGYEHYKNLWSETDKKLESARIKAAQRWTYFNGGLVSGIIVAILLKIYVK